jgi:hypothetical protein
VVRIGKDAKFAFADAANQRSAGVRIDEQDLVLHDALPRSGKDANNDANYVACIHVSEGLKAGLDRGEDMGYAMEDKDKEDWMLVVSSTPSSTSFSLL